MKHLELFKGDNLDEIWPAKKTMPVLWWMKENQALKDASNQQDQ